MEKKIISINKQFGSTPQFNLVSQENESQINSHYQSPIYRITEEPVSSDELEDFQNGAILFIYVQSLFESYSVLSYLFEEPTVSFWLSNGLANLVLISPDASKLNAIKDKLQDTNVVNAYEIWNIKDNSIAESEYNLFPTIKPEILDLKLEDFSGELLFIAREFVSGIGNILNKCSFFTPQFIEHYCCVKRKGVKLLSDALAVEKKLKDSPSIYDESLFTSYISDLVEINSVISYSLTQGFAGTPPILENPAVMQSYSLLGIGTNYKGYLSLYNHVHSIFKHFNIPEILKGKYNSDGGFALGKVNRSRLIKGERGRSHKEIDSEHLIYFSGRLGFRESKNAISASLFCIALGATNRWNLLTFSHEYMHAHVRELISIILGPQNGASNGSYEKVGDTKFSEISDKYNKFIKNNNSNEQYTTLDCLAFSIIRFYQSMEYYEDCNARIKAGKLLKRTQFEVREISADWLRSVIQAPGNWKLLNELVVHVLDYQYFYDGSNEIYIPVLWESWSTVPQVRGNLDLYIFRTLASLVSNTSEVKDRGSEQSKAKNQEHRFELAFSELQNKLEEIRKNGKGTQLIDEAIEFMGIEENKDHLGSKVIVSLGLIDDIMSIIHHPSIHASVIHDPKLTNEVYPFGKLDFSGVKVTSPVAFLQSQVFNEEHVEVDNNNEVLSIWNSLACISAVEYKKGAT